MDSACWFGLSVGLEWEQKMGLTRSESVLQYEYLFHRVDEKSEEKGVSCVQLVSAFKHL